MVIDSYDVKAGLDIGECTGDGFYKPCKFLRAHFNEVNEYGESYKTLLLYCKMSGKKLSQMRHCPIWQRRFPDQYPDFPYNDDDEGSNK